MCFWTYLVGKEGRTSTIYQSVTNYCHNIICLIYILFNLNLFFRFLKKMARLIDMKKWICKHVVLRHGTYPHVEAGPTNIEWLAGWMFDHLMTWYFHTTWHIYSLYSLITFLFVVSFHYFYYCYFIRLNSESYVVDFFSENNIVAVF